MGSLKFATGLSLLSYESCRPNAFAFLSSFPLAFQAVSLKRSPFQFQPTLLASSLAGSIEPGFKVSPICLIVLERLSFGRTCAFSVSFESGDLGTFVVPYLRRFSFCDYTIPRPCHGVYSQSRQSLRETFVQAVYGKYIDGCGIINMFGVPKSGPLLSGRPAFAIAMVQNKRYIVSGALILNMVSTLWITPRTARQSAIRPCCTVLSSASRMRQAL